MKQIVFYTKKFTEALFYIHNYHQIFLKIKEYPIYALFCDIASEDEEKQFHFLTIFLS